MIARILSHFGYHKQKVNYFPHFRMSDFGIGPISDDAGKFRCDVCKRYRDDVSISPGDGYAECGDCR